MMYIDENGCYSLHILNIECVSSSPPSVFLSLWSKMLNVTTQSYKNSILKEFSLWLFQAVLV